MNWFIFAHHMNLVLCKHILIDIVLITWMTRNGLNWEVCWWFLFLCIRQAVNGLWTYHLNKDKQQSVCISVEDPAWRSHQTKHWCSWCFSADALSCPRASEEHTGLMRHTPASYRGLCVCVCVQQEAAFWNTCRRSALPLLSHHSCSDRNRNS